MNMEYVAVYSKGKISQSFFIFYVCGFELSDLSREQWGKLHAWNIFV